MAVEMNYETSTRDEVPGEAPDKVAETVWLKADAATLVIKAEEDGKLRLTCSTWDDRRVALAGETVKLRWEKGQVVVVRCANLAFRQAAGKA